MIQIKSITVNKEFVRAPVHIQLVTENGQERFVRFEPAGFVTKDRIRFERVTGDVFREQRSVP